MQDFFSQGPTVQAQHRIVENLGWGINIPLDSASYQIEQGQMEYAVESIEHGRALLWSEMRGLRTSVDQLHIVDSGLADRFQVVSQALEGIATTVSQHGAAQLRRGKSGDRGESDAFSCTLKQHHKFQQERQEIISRVRDLPDFRHFLRPAPFETLKDAASAGPIIIVNHCGWRCDIVIVLHSAPISIIPIPSHFTNVQIHWQRSSWTRESLTCWNQNTIKHSALGAQRVTRTRRSTSHQESPGAGYSRAVTNLVVSNVRFLLSSSPCHGANPIEQESKAVLFRPMCVFIHTVA